jgi:hypothetical protein
LTNRARLKAPTSDLSICAQFLRAAARAGRGRHTRKSPHRQFSLIECSLSWGLRAGLDIALFRIRP